MSPCDEGLSEQLRRAIRYCCGATSSGGLRFRLSLTLPTGAPTSTAPEGSEREWVIPKNTLEQCDRAGVLDEFLLLRRLREEQLLLEDFG